MAPQLLRATLSAAALLSLASPAAAERPAAATRPMTIRDLLGAVRVSDPQLSPDGSQVAFVRTTTDVATGKRNADIWVVPADGSAPPRLLVGGDKTENTPRWTANRLLFLSNRDGETQVYAFSPRADPEVHQVTKVPGGVQPPLVISPDGRSLAFVADKHEAQKTLATVGH